MAKILQSKLAVGVLWTATLLLFSFGAYELGSLAEARYERLTERADAVSKLMDQGRYDEAIQIRLDENKAGRPDGYTFDGIALIYLERAKNDLANRQRWVQQASLYYDKATAAAPRNPFILENAMDGYNRLGDYIEKGCPDYEKAIGFGDAAVALLQGSTVTVEGQRRPYPTQPIRESIEPRLKRIRGKVEAWCRKTS